MRGTIAKKIALLIPNSAIPAAILNNPNINKKRFKKTIWNNLNMYEKSKITSNYRKHLKLA